MPIMADRARASRPLQKGRPRSSVRLSRVARSRLEPRPPTAGDRAPLWRSRGPVDKHRRGRCDRGRSISRGRGSMWVDSFRSGKRPQPWSESHSVPQRCGPSRVPRESRDGLAPRARAPEFFALGHAPRVRASVTVLDAAIARLTITGPVPSFRAIAAAEEYQQPMADWIPNILSYSDLPDAAQALGQRLRTVGRLDTGSLL